MKRRILVVDDDPAILEVLEMRLTMLGFDVGTTSDPAHAVAEAERGRCDVALLDLRMEPVDGIRLMEQLHVHQPRLPVLIMTAHGTIETAVDALQRGAFDYLTKPFVRDELRAKIGRALATRRWARDRERLLSIGGTLASSGVIERVFEAVAQAAAETIDAERCAVFQRSAGHLVRMASTGPPPAPWSMLEEAAALAMSKGAPATTTAADGRVLVAAPLVVEGEAAGALVIEAPARVEPTHDDLELLALFSAQAAAAIHNSHELERLRSGALAALGRMATEVAHELRNPLAGLRLYARHLEQRLQAGGDGAAAGLARKITSTVDHLAGVVSEITAFGRPPDLQRVPAALHPILDECLALARARCTTANVTMERAYDASCPEIRVDSRELRKAFLNLFLNGLEALAPGGRLTVRTTYAPGSGTVTVVVEDTGTGMSEETLARAFDLFFTTKPEGTGLGMAITRSVIDLHDGTLDIESAPGQGTRVRVRLPVGAPADAEAART